MARSNAFTLVEVLIVVIILGILAAAIVPAFTEASDSARCATTATMVKSLTRRLTTVRMETGSYPASIDASMFEGSTLPTNPFDPNATVIFQIDSTAGKLHPGTKTIHSAGAFWYNLTNGIVRARVTACSTSAETIALYNAANACKVTSLGQTN